MAATNLINTTLSNLAGGVSEQYQEGRFDSQVSAMENCMPSITRGVLRRNPLEDVDTLVSPVTALPSDLSDCYIYSYDRGTGTEQYLVIIPGDGYIHTFNANDGSHLYTNAVLNPYLQVGVGNIAKKSFKAITIGDHTFIVNNTITTSFTTDVASSSGYSDMAFYWIKKTISVVTKQYQSSTDVGSLMRGYTYTLNSLEVTGAEDTRPGQTLIDLNTSNLIAAEFADNPTDSLVDTSDGPIAYKLSYTGSDWKWNDSFGDEASIGVWKTVKDSSELPVNLPSDLDDFIVKVSGGTSAEFDDYYLQYNYTNKSWKEVPAPGSLTTLDEDTMPHVLYRLSGGFEFNTYQGVITDGSALDGVSSWGTRESGGDEALEDPSFIGKTINNIFFHKNRLGFITSDTIILSKTGDYGGFFIQTLQESLDDDPIDLAVASTDVTILRHAVPTAGQLILFADDTQFSLESLEGPLTPNSADITPLSNYTYGANADAVSIGNRVFFSNQVGGHSQIYSYKVTDRGSQVTEATPMTLHLPTYIDKSISKVIGHDVLGYTFMEEEDKATELIVLTSVIRGNEELQNAFHKWTFIKDIVSTQIINNDLYIVFSDGDLTKMSLEVPSDSNSVNYMDTYNSVDGEQEYESYIVFSEFFIRDDKGKGTVRGRYQIRTLQYTITEDSKYVTTISNTNHSILDDETMMGPTWTDTDVWDDTKIWVDIDPLYTREYVDDSLVTVMSNSKNTEITFKSSELEPSKGFELATANIEGFMHQRSRRGR